MTTFTIIGNGNMANAIKGVLIKTDPDIQIIEHSQVGKTDLLGTTIILAVPYGAVAEIVDIYREQLSGKTVVDISNPLDFSTFDSLVVPADSSAAAELQQQLSDSSVLKAFNTNFAATLASGNLGSVKTTVLIAGDDNNAKEKLIQAINIAGLSAIDAGGLSRARELESLGFLQLTLAVSEKLPWTGGFAIISE